MLHQKFGNGKILTIECFNKIECAKVQFDTNEEMWFKTNYLEHSE